MPSVRSDADGEEARARARERATHPAHEGVGRRLARGRVAVSDVHDGGLLGVVEPLEGGLEHRPEVGGAGDAVVGELLQRLRDVRLCRLGEALLGVDDLRRDVERDQGEAVLVRERAEDGLRRRGPLGARALVSSRRGVHHHDELALRRRQVREVDVVIRYVTQHHVVSLVAARAEPPGAHGDLGGLRCHLELEISLRRVAAAPHRH